MSDQDDRQGLILASGSRTRRHLLQAAGLQFTVEPADLDEEALRRPFMRDDGQGDGRAIAETLAAAKARSISKLHADAIVLGADQTLMLEGQVLSKASSVDDARATLQSLRGKTHQLFAAVALAEGGEVVWSTVAEAKLSMRKFSDAFLEDYLARIGDVATSAVGAYEYEGIGLQLFEVGEGDFFTILGMPMLELVRELRRRGVVMS